MASGLLSMFTEEGRPATIAEYLERSSYDELAEFYPDEDRYRSICHVEGKYHVPIADGTFSSLYDYTLNNLIHPEDRDIFARFFDPETLSQRLAESEIPGAITAQYRYKLQDGGWCWTEQCLIGDGRHGIPKGTVRFYVFDIENLKSRELGGASARHFVPKNERDRRTGLLVRTLFFAKLSERLESLPPAGQWCLATIDIDHFNLFNEWHGREVGDFLLADIGSLLARIEEECDGLAGYLGQDDFCLYAPFDRHAVEELFDDISELISSHGSAVGFVPVFGVSLVEGPITALDLFDQAKIALGNAKADFRKHICLFRQPMREQQQREYRILADFFHGLKNGEVFFQLQPQCRMSTGKIVGAEALARWRKPDGTTVPPIEFIPVLERHGFITDLDTYIWEEVCIWLRAWLDAGHVAVPVSVNVSQVDFYLIDVPEHLEALVAEYDLDPSLLKVEITESAYVNNAAVVQDATARLREKGFLVLMDDFGSGYSSLNTLRTLNVDVIKLDAQFLRIGEDEGHKGLHILESVINMAKSLNLPIVSEGVETDEQSTFLESQGCRYVQGFKYYRPMDSEQFEQVIADGSIIDTRGFVPKLNEQIRVRELFDEHVYSDSMLNSILGAVALYSWHGDDVDIVRFNEQFYEVINSPKFHDLRGGIQKLMPGGEVPKLYALLAGAEENVMTGSSGVLSFYRADGSLNRYLFRFYFLGEKDGGKLFYGSVRDVTEITELQNQMKLISRFSSDTIVFVRDRAAGRRFEIVVHGLEDMMGLSREELQAELDSGAFFERVEDRMSVHLKHHLLEVRNACLALRFTMTNARGEAIELFVKSDTVDDETSDVAYILVFRSH